MPILCVRIIFVWRFFFGDMRFVSTTKFPIPHPFQFIQYRFIQAGKMYLKKNLLLCRSGARRRTPPTTAGFTRHFILHGSDIHRHILFGDVDQVVGVGFPQLLYERLVLVGLHNRHGKTITF